MMMEIHNNDCGLMFDWRKLYCGYKLIRENPWESNYRLMTQNDVFGNFRRIKKHDLLNSKLLTWFVIDDLE